MGMRMGTFAGMCITVSVKRLSGPSYATHTSAPSVCIVRAAHSLECRMPFASAERWEPPVDFTKHYESVPLNATMWGAACLQVLTSNTSYGSEDCLKVLLSDTCDILVNK